MDQNHGLSPLGKCQFFDCLNFLFLQPRKFLFFVKYGKRHFPGLLWLKKMLEKLPFLEKCQFSDFLNFLFYSLESWFFVVKYRKGNFPGLYCRKKKVGKMVIFGRKPWVIPLGKCQFFDFLNFLFLQPRKLVFCCKVS